MKLAVKSLDNEEVGDIELADEVFGLPCARTSWRAWCNWQLAKRRAGTHKTKGISDIQGTTKKPWKQKGTGRARQGRCARRSSEAAPLSSARWCAATNTRSQKKVRRLALKTALSAKQAEGKLVVLDQAQAKDAKTKALAQRFEKLGWHSVLIIGGPQLDENFARAARNLPMVDVLPLARRQCLRHPAPRYAGADARSGSGPGGAPQMSRFRFIQARNAGSHARSRCTLWCARRSSPRRRP